MGKPVVGDVVLVVREYKPLVPPPIGRDGKTAVLVAVDDRADYPFEVRYPDGRVVRVHKIKSF